MCRYRKRLILRNWLLQLWGLACLTSAEQTAHPEGPRQNSPFLWRAQSLGGGGNLLYSKSIDLNVNHI